MPIEADFRLQAVLFDLDGTLLDTFPAIIGGWNAVMAPLVGREHTTDEVLARFGPHDEAMLAQELAAYPHIELADATERYYAAYTAAHGGVAAFDGIEALLAGVEQHHIPMGIMTGKSRRALEITLQGVGWNQRFTASVAGTEISHPKPDPEGVLRVAQQLGVDPGHCLYVGDMPADVGAARNAGMKAVAALWHPYFETQVRALAPDFIADHPSQVLQLVGRLWSDS